MVVPVCKFIVSNFTLGLAEKAINTGEIKLPPTIVDEQLVKIGGCCAERRRRRRCARGLLR